MQEEENRPWQAFHNREVSGPGWSSYGESVTGRRRAANQDSFMLIPLHSSRLLAAVADGLGGHNAGDVASRTACDAIYTCVARGLLDGVDDGDATIERKLEQITREAHHAIARRSIRDPDLQGMASTLTLALVSDRAAWFCHVGDSRLYHVAGSGCRQMTEDHIAAGAVGVAGDPGKGHMLNQALGLEDPGSDLDISVGRTRLSAGDSLLLCTDGLSDRLSEDNLADIVCAGTSAVKRVHDLLQAALHAGSADDITALLIDLTASRHGPGEEVGCST